jgi:hypothetical protein
VGADGQAESVRVDCIGGPTSTAHSTKQLGCARMAIEIFLALQNAARVASLRDMLGRSQNLEQF